MSLYLTLGQVPARFAVMKIRLMFLKYILDEEDRSMISRVLQLQVKQPTKGDWASSCLADLKLIKLTETFQDIKLMKKNKFEKIISTKIDIAALEFLTSRQKRKGSEMFYSEIIMSEYLMPQTELKISEKEIYLLYKSGLLI